MEKTIYDHISPVPTTIPNPKDKPFLKLEGINMDVVYENFIRQIAGERLQDQPGELKEALPGMSGGRNCNGRLQHWRIKYDEKSNSTSKSPSTVS